MGLSGVSLGFVVGMFPTLGLSYVSVHLCVLLCVGGFVLTLV
jgi:hypothetical protein